MLGVYMLITAVNQLLWITFAPITSDATQFYGVSDLKIGILSMCFMVVYLIVSVPASYFIDTYGIRAGVGVGVAFTGIFGLLRGLVPSSYTMILVSQIGIAIGQPFILNSITKVAARWFPISERATASGLGTLAMYLGILVAMVLTPFLVNWSGIDGMLTTYGVLSAVAAVAFFVLAKERPLTPPCHSYQEERALAVDGLKQIFRKKDFNWLMFIFFVGLGVFNAVTTWIENIVYPRGFTSEQAGITGGLMIIGGLLGAVVMPVLSDRYKRRIPFIIIALAGATIGLAGIAFATGYWLLLASGGAFGFFLLSSGPIGFQYGAEVTYPVSEGTSNGFLLLMGQISGIAFIFGMDSFKSAATGSMAKPLIFMTGLMVLSFLATLMLRESSFLSKPAEERAD